MAKTEVPDVIRAMVGPGSPVKKIEKGYAFDHPCQGEMPVACSIVDIVYDPKKVEELPTLFDKIISAYHPQIMAGSNDAFVYTGTVRAIIAKNGNNIVESSEAEYARYAIHRATEIGAVSELIAYALHQADENRYAPAEFVLSKLVQDQTKDPKAYTGLAKIVRLRNTTADLGKEEYAKWLDWKAQNI